MKLLLLALYNSPIKETLKEVWVHKKWFNIEVMKEILDEVGFKDVTLTVEFDCRPD